MSHVTIKRYEREVPVTLSSTEEVSLSLRMSGMAGGVVSLAAMDSAATTLQMWGSSSEAGPYRRICKTDGTLAEVTLAGAAASTEGLIYSLPDEVFAVAYLKLVLGSAAGDGTLGSVTLKS
jgi:hypothetical protein